MSETASIDGLKHLADHLAQLPLRHDAELFYELLSGAVIWRDEMPQGFALNLDCLNALRAVWHFRTATILGENAQHCEPSWIAAKRLFPTWPGFAPERCSTALRDTVLRLREESHTQLETDWQELIDP